MATTTTLFAQAIGDSFTVNDISYTVTDDTLFEVEVSGSTLTDITIPATVDNWVTTYNVTAIGENAFNGDADLATVILPTSVVTINNQSFRDCASLTSINLENIVTINGSNNFNEAKMTSVTLTNLVNLGDYGLLRLRQITELELPAAETIGLGALRDLNALTTITIPSTVTSLGGQFMQGASVLEEIHLQWTDLSGLSFTSTDYLKSTTGTVYIYVPVGYKAVYQGSLFDTASIGAATIILEEGEPIPTGTVVGTAFEVGDYSYSVTALGTTNEVTVTGVSTTAAGVLTMVDIPATVDYDSITFDVISISNNAFDGNAIITSANLPSSIKTLGERAFAACPLLETLDTADITTIDQNIINGSHAITTLDLSELTVMARNGLGRSRIAGTLDLPKVTLINEWAFYETEITTLNLPSILTEIQGNSLHSMANLTTINISASTPPSINNDTTFNMGSTVPAGVTLNVPTGTSIAYDAAAGWTEFGTINEDSSLSTKNLENNLEASVYPNPATKVVNISTASGNAETKVYSITGKLLFSTNKNQVDISALSAGMYVLKIVDGNSFNTSRIIKK